MVVTRFCPSNTGNLHIGSARTAIFAYAYAKKMGGRCILRIENTDKARSTHESLMDIMEGLEWLGLEFDDGPSMDDVRAKKYDAKYFQSERAHVYNEHIDRLVKEDKAYINDDKVTVFRMPKENITVNDLILGDVEYPASEQKDFPIRRADGSVLFHACVVLDDALSGVTHVIRANDHLANTPKHIKLYEAFGFKVPQYSHMPLILDDKGAKLSKRRTDQFVLIKDFRANGFLPSAVINLIGLMGWSTPDGREDFDLKYMCQNFDLKDCLKANSKYDATKLLNFNARDIKKLPKNDFEREAFFWASNYSPEFIENMDVNVEFSDLCKVFQDRCKTFGELPKITKFATDSKIDYNPKAIEKVMIKDKGLDILPDLKDRLQSVDKWDSENIMGVINGLAADKGVSVGKVAQPLRVAVTGDTMSPPIDQTLILIGKDKTLNRIAQCLSANLVGA